MRIAFTGTRKGMTVAQWKTVQDIFFDQFNNDDPNEFHGGDAIGADHQALESVKMVKQSVSIETHGHPCNLEKYRAYDEFDVMHEVLAPLVRNRIMVEDTDLTVAAPYEYDEIIRGSGTWAAMRYARAHRELIVVWPDGTQKHLTLGGLF